MLHVYVEHGLEEPEFVPVESHPLASLTIKGTDIVVAIENGDIGRNIGVFNPSLVFFIFYYYVLTY